MEAEVTKEKTRIYVGGLGGGVTEEDLRKTFAALGEVVAVDVVRTKGRSFAYLDFIPSSDKSLPKLFSTYNGCTWKGGKLRLEKAKEHYLQRMRREWAEDAEHASKVSSNNADPSENHHTSEKPNKPSSDKMQLHIFFPKLQKVKSLASVGIGKHKYSFQRINVPSIPNHFCDCEEHSRHFLTTNEKLSPEFENANNGINEQEFSIMNSVMNKILERENPKKPESVNGREISVNSNDEFHPDENDEEDHPADEDNLIINVVSGKGDTMNLLGEMKAIMANQEPVTNRLRTSSSKKPKNALDNQKMTISPLGKKRKSPYSEENDNNNNVIPETAKKSESQSNTHVGNRKESESGSKQPGSTSLRSKKSTWKDLIGQKGSTPFSISDIISTVPQEKETETKSDDLDLLLTKDVHDTKKSLPRNKKRKTNGDSGPETTQSQLPINDQEDTRKVDSVTREISVEDIAPQKGEEPRTGDHNMPLTTTHEFSIPDVLPKQKEDTTNDDDLDMPLTSNVENKKHEDADGGVGNEDLIRTARGESWRHKSSWTQLISNTGDSPFSLSLVVPNLSFEKHQPQVANQNLNLDTAITESEVMVTEQQQMISEKEVNKTLEQKRNLCLGNMDSEDTCPFMRTEASIKEWKKAKAALTGKLNKKKRSVE